MTNPEPAPDFAALLVEAARAQAVADRAIWAALQAEPDDMLRCDFWNRFYAMKHHAARELSDAARSAGQGDVS